MLDKFRNYADKGRLDYDLTFLYGLRKRIPLQGNGPRHLLLSNNKLIIPTYFADVLNMVDLNTFSVAAVNMNVGRTETKEQKGEKYFMMRDIVIRGGKVVNGCHPGDGRTDV